MKKSIKTKIKEYKYEVQDPDGTWHFFYQGKVENIISILNQRYNSSDLFFLNFIKEITTEGEIRWIDDSISRFRYEEVH